MSARSEGSSEITMMIIRNDVERRRTFGNHPFGERESDRGICTLKALDGADRIHLLQRDQPAIQIDAAMKARLSVERKTERERRKHELALLK